MPTQPYQVPPAGNQASFQDDQNYRIDIDTLYNDFIKEIDSVRSYIFVAPLARSKILNAISGNANQAVTNYLTPNDTYQESRCHAFFRLIGLPAASANFQFYNPGHDIVNIKGASRTQTLSYKISIASNPISGFVDLSSAREQYQLTTATVFAANTSIDASVLALTSGSATSTQSVNLRQFAAPFNSDPGNAFAVNTTGQSYPVGTVSLVGKNEVLFSKYLDANNNSSQKLNSTRQHIIRPLMVDPVIDFAVNPSTRRIGVPFVPDKSYLKVASDVYAKRPLLEKVIRDRLSISDQSDNLQPAQTSIINYIKSIPAVQKQAIISQVTSDVYNLAEQTQFANFLNIIQEMMTQLVNALRIIHKAQSIYYWVPLVSTSGPEGGSSVQDVFLTTQQMLTNGLVTAADKKLLLRIINAQTNLFDNQAAQAQGVPDVGGFAFSSFKTTFNSDTSSGFQDSNQLSVDNMLSVRTGILQKAGNALRMVEIITGEFSGFGMCDIIAIMGSLYLMPQASLLGLLDSDSFARMKNSLGQNASAATQNGYQASMADLSNNVQAFYQLMDSIYGDILQSQGLPT